MEQVFRCWESSRSWGFERHCYIGDPAVGVHGKIVGVLGVAPGDGGTHRRDVRPAPQMLLEDLTQGQVDRHVAAGQYHIVLTDLFQIGVYAAQGVHAAPVVPLPALVGVAEGG